MHRILIAAALSCAAIQPIAAQEGSCTSEQDILANHRMALIERLGPADAALFMAELAKLVGDPPQAIKPSAVLVFDSESGLQLQFFDENHCASFGASMSGNLFTTIRSKIDDVTRAESEVKRFELSIDGERKRLQKTLEAAKLGLKNARIQMAVELQKVDGVGFTKAAELVKEVNRA